MFASPSMSCHGAAQGEMRLAYHRKPTWQIDQKKIPSGKQTWIFIENIWFDDCSSKNDDHVNIHVTFYQRVWLFLRMCPKIDLWMGNLSFDAFRPTQWDAKLTFEMPSTIASYCCYVQGPQLSCKSIYQMFPSEMENELFGLRFFGLPKL